MSTQLIPYNNNNEAVTAMITAANLADSTKLKYQSVIAGYEGSLTDPAGLAAYADTLSNSRKSCLKAVIKLWTNDMIDRVKGGATPDNVNQVQASIYRFESLQTAVTVKASNGEKAHTWLSQSEVKKLMALPDVATAAGLRDKVALGLLVAAGLRREEAVSLAFDAIKMQPIKGKIRTVIEVMGKGQKNRIVPISDVVATCIERWRATAGPGLILRSVSQVGEIGDGLSAVGLFKIVRGYGRAMDKPELAPHDLRRTYAQIGYESGVPITQISKLLGHSNIATTQRYLNLSLDLETTVSDFVPF